MKTSQIARNFVIQEFACKDGTPVPAELMHNVRALAICLQVIRDVAAKPLVLNSAYRTVSHNMHVGGASRSYHLQAMAADISCVSISPARMYAIILKLMDEGKIIQGGLKQYPTFVHYDIRGVKTLF